MWHTALTALVLGAILRATAQVVDPAQATTNIAQPEDALTSAARFKLLNEPAVSFQQPPVILGTILSHDPQFVYDFNAGVSTSNGVSGSIITANLAGLPSIVCQLTPLAGGHIACELSTPHHHTPPAGFLRAVSGSNLKVDFVQEEEAKFVANILSPGHGAIFPKGTFRLQANLEGEPVYLAAGLNSADTGVATVQVAHRCKRTATQVRLPVD